MNRLWRPSSAYRLAKTNAASVFAIKSGSVGGLIEDHEVGEDCQLSRNSLCMAVTMLEGAVGTIASAHLFSRPLKI